MGRLRQVELDSQTAFASASKNVDFSPDNLANGAIISLNVSAVGGTTPGPTTAKLQYKDPDSGVFIDYPNGALNSIATTGLSVISIVPDGLAAITSGAWRSTPSPLGGAMRVAMTFDRTNGDETYTYTLSVEYYSW